MRLLTLHIVLLLLLQGSLFSQPRDLSSTNKKAINSYKSALEAYDKYDFKTAEKHLKDAIRLDGQFIEAYLMLSQAYMETNMVEEAVTSAEGAIAINPDFFPNLHINLGNFLFRRGDYERAKKYLSYFLTYKNVRAEIKDFASFRLNCCEFALHALENPVPFTPINLGPNVNSKLDEYWPSLSADENTLVITVNSPIDVTSPEVMYNRQEDFYITTRDSDGDWKPVRNIGPPINTPQFNEGAQSLTADGQRMYFTVCRGNCDIYVSDRDMYGNWGRPQRLPEPLNLVHSSEKQPSISPDGRTLYFVSNRNSKKDNFDIWYSTRLDDYHWSEPMEIGDSINTPLNEQSPFIHFDNQTLYFSSNGHVGMGGLHIFVSRRLNDTLWSKPVNLGYPINTFRDEDGLIVNAAGTMAYFSSDINPQTGRDIYMFELPNPVRPIPSSYISGKIIDAKTERPLKAKFNLVDVESGEEIMNTNALEGGSFFLCIPTNRKYAFFASMPGYLFHSDHIDLVGIHSADKPFRKNIELHPIMIGETMVMRNIFYETDSYELKPESLVELKKLLELLTQNPTMKIEIGGHTDYIGSAEYNQTLSGKRAKAVADFLVNSGVDTSRIAWEGYGLTKPIGDNSTEEGRAKNRRTEIRVIGM